MLRKKVKKNKVCCSILKEFNAIFQEEPETGGFSVWVPGLPGCASQGETFEEAKKNIIEAIELYLEDTPDEELEGLDPRRQFMAPVGVRFYA